MKRIPLIAAGLLLLAGCSREYLKSGTLSPDFKADRTYSIAVMPIAVRGQAPAPDLSLRNAAWSRLQSRLMATGRFKVIDRFKIEQALNVNEFGSTGKVEPALARKIAREVGGEMAALLELEFEQVGGKLQATVAEIQMLDVSSDYVVYAGKGRTANPVSAEAGAELAVEFATQVLVDKLK
jgi:hypothetical protein